MPKLVKIIGNKGRLVPFDFSRRIWKTIRAKKIKLKMRRKEKTKKRLQSKPVLKFQK